MFKAVLLWLRAFIYPVFVIIHTLISSVIVTALLVFRAPRSWADYAIVNMWCAWMVRMAGIKIQVTGLENVPRENGFLYLFTHSSYLDVPALMVASPKSFRFGAKASLFKIPIFSTAVRLSGTLPIARESRDKVMEVYRQAEERVRNGEAFALSPEGGRRSQREIKDFKTGPFEFAMNAHMPVVPVVLSGFDEVMRKGSLLVSPKKWTHVVQISFLPARDVPLMEREQLREFKESVRQEVVTEYERLQGL